MGKRARSKLPHVPVTTSLPELQQTGDQVSQALLCRYGAPVFLATHPGATPAGVAPAVGAPSSRTGPSWSCTRRTPSPHASRRFTSGATSTATRLTCLLTGGATLWPIEIKAGQTFQPAWLKGLDWFNKPPTVPGRPCDLRRQRGLPIPICSSLAPGTPSPNLTRTARGEAAACTDREHR